MWFCSEADSHTGLNSTGGQGRRRPAEEGRCFDTGVIDQIAVIEQIIDLRVELDANTFVGLSP